MTPRRNIEHKFDLTGMKAGEWFMGCERCWTQLPVMTAGPRYCHCGEHMRVYDVTHEDVRLALKSKSKDA